MNDEARRHPKDDPPDHGHDQGHDHAHGEQAGQGGAAAVDTSALFGPSVDCVEAVHELYSYLDGELTEVRREEIRIHLDWCGPCGGAAHFEAELRRVIADKCKDRVPDNLIDRVAAAIDEESRQHDANH
jgi:mycothiol system anti-sigma-R factor